MSLYLERDVSEWGEVLGRPSAPLTLRDAMKSKRNDELNINQ